MLLDCVEAAGLSVDEARTTIDQRTFEQAVDEDWAKSQQYGVSGVPTYVTGGYGVVGAQPYEVLEKLMQEVGAQKRN